MTTAQQLQLSQQCQSLFREGNLDQCISELQKLGKSTGSDGQFKVRHNILVCQFHSDKRILQPAELLSKLQKFKEEVESKKGSQDQDADGVNDDVDTAVLSCNIAVTALQLRKYSLATEALERLFRHIEPLEELVAIRLCMMLMDCWAIHRLPDRAQQVVAFMEKTVQGLTAIKAQDNSKPDASQNTVEMWDQACRAYNFKSLAHVKVLLSMYKAKLFLAQRNIKAAKREIKAAVSASPPEAQTAPVVLRASLEFMRGNLKKAQKLLTSIIDQSTLPLQLNNLGCLHYKAQKYGAASLFFKKSLQAMNDNDAGDAQKVSNRADVVNRKAEVLYNLGLQHLLLGRPEIAFKCLVEASPLFYGKPRLWIRLAECCISHHAQKQSEAEQKFETDLVRNIAGQGPKRRVLLPFGLSSCRGLRSSVMTSISTPQTDGDTSGGLPSPQSGDAGVDAKFSRKASLSLEYGMRCLENALFLLSKDGSAQVPSFGVSSGSQGLGSGMQNMSGPGVLDADGNKEGDDTLSQGPNNQSKEQEIWLLTQASLAKLAYVSLALDNPVQALGCAQKLLAQEDNCSSAYRYAARMYAAEAMCVLQQAQGAAEVLEPLTREAADTAADFMARSTAHIGSWAHLSESTGQWPASRCAVQINLAAIHIIRQDFTQALTCVRNSLSLIPNSAPALLLAVYLEIRTGNTGAALRILKRRRANNIP